MPSAPGKKSQTEATSQNGNKAPDGEATTAEGSYRAKRYALKYQPPCIFLEYEDTSKKRRVRAVKINGVQANVDVDKLTRKVIRSFPRKLDPSSVKYDQVRKLVVKLIEYLAATTGGAAAPSPSPAAPSSSAAAGSGALHRNGSLHLGPSRLGPGGGGGVSGSHDGTAASATGAGRLWDPSGGAAVEAGSFSSPLPTLSPRMDSQRLTAGRLGAHLGHLSGYHRGSVESSMSRFSTSTAGCSSDEEVEGEQQPQEEEEEQERHSSGQETEEEQRQGEGGGGGRGHPLASALDDLDRELEDLAPGAPTSILSTRINGSGESSEMTSRDSSFSFRDRPAGGSGGVSAAAAPAPAPALPPTSTTGTTAAAAAAAGAPGAGPGAGGKSRFAAEAEKLTIGLEVTDELDLNKVTDVELKMAKAAMEQNFVRNQLRPGDPGYVYDVQAEFGPPTEDNDWDEDSDDDGGDAPSKHPEVDWADIQAAVRKPTSVVVQAPAGRPPTVSATGPSSASGEDSSTSPGGRGGRASQSPYNSNDWP